MGSRQDHSYTQFWKKWTNQHAADLARCGIPASICGNERYWGYFLDHGYVGDNLQRLLELDWLSVDQLLNLHALLSEPGIPYEDDAVCLLRYIQAELRDRKNA